MEDWVKENVHNIMIIIGVGSALGVAVIFGAYIAVKRKLKRDKNTQSH